MINHWVSLLSLIFLYSYSSEPKLEQETSTVWAIKKHQFGPIKIGMDLKQANSLIKGYEKSLCDVSCYGYDGGGEAQVYSKNGQESFAIIPSYTNQIIAIAIKDSSFVTTNGLRPNASIRLLNRKYNPLTIYKDEAIGFEYVEDHLNHWQFVFETNEQNEIGRYTEVGLGSAPRITNQKADYLLIK